MKEIAASRKAYHDYEISDRFEAGIVLNGMEIKAIRAGKVNLTGAHAKILTIKQGNKVTIIKPELYILNLHIGVKTGDHTRTRKLLMHRSEIDKLIGKTQIKGLTLIPTRLYLKNGRAKIELGLGRGKKLHDKRETIKKRDLDRARKKGEE